METWIRIAATKTEDNGKLAETQTPRSKTKIMREFSIAELPVEPIRKKDSLEWIWTKSTGAYCELLGDCFFYPVNAPSRPIS
jgi:hypothetical protein